MSISQAVEPQPFSRDFYLQPTTEVSQQLLGHYLLRRTPEGLCGGLIVETEAYLTDDPACHAYRRETPRNRSMWGAPGRAYVYQIYGMHFCVNAVCQHAGIAEAVLVRAIEPTFGLEIMQRHRAVNREVDLTNGPAKFCRAMGINLALDGFDLCDSQSPLFVARNPEVESARQERAPLVTTTRIGITRAADWPLRFYLDGSRYVSKRAPRGAASNFPSSGTDGIGTATQRTVQRVSTK